MDVERCKRNAVQVDHMVAGDLHIGTPHKPKTKCHSGMGMNGADIEARQNKKEHMGAESSDLQVCL
jgi:hypothetical protein